MMCEFWDILPKKRRQVRTEVIQGVGRQQSVKQADNIETGRQNKKSPALRQPDLKSRLFKISKALFIRSPVRDPELLGLLFLDIRVSGEKVANSLSPPGKNR